MLSTVLSWSRGKLVRRHQLSSVSEETNSIQMLETTLRLSKSTQASTKLATVHTASPREEHGFLQISSQPLQGSLPIDYWSRRSRHRLGKVERGGAGIMFFAYGSDKTTFNTFASQVVTAGKLIRKHSPEIPLAVATSFDYHGFEVFDHIIKIREDHNFAGSNYQKRSDGLSRQWLTRILYMTATPFEVTLAYDANVATCGSLLPVFQRLIESDFDLAVASVGQKSSLPEEINPHNFAIAYKWNVKVAKLFDEWFMEQVGAGVALDDQHTLLRAVREIQKREDFNFKVLNPVLASAFVSTKASEGFFPRETRVIVGKVLVVHDNPNSAAVTCSVFNAHDDLRRQVISDGKNTYSVFNDTDCSAKLDRPRCKFHALWNDTGVGLIVPPIS